MLILECFTEKRPFYKHYSDAAIIHARIHMRQSPYRPGGPNPENHVSDELWSLMERCWSPRPDVRPTMQQVHSFFLRNVDAAV